VAHDAEGDGGSQRDFREQPPDHEATAKVPKMT